MQMSRQIIDNQLETLFQRAIIGLEKESQRINRAGELVQTDHPDVFGNRSYHPYIQTDFAESQLELITPPVHSVQEAMEWMAAIHDVVYQTIPEDEALLPFSTLFQMPKDEAIHVAKLDTEEDVAYRNYLVEVYGKRKQMMSGIHYNFEFEPTFVEALYNAEATNETYVAFRTKLYMSVAQRFLRYQWLLTYFFGASIEVTESYFQDETIPEDIPTPYVKSLRSSKYGYVNKSDVAVSFDSLEAYTESIEQMVVEGKLIHEKEFYSPVRFRGGRKAREVLENGITYLELRLFDLNPFAPYGMTVEDATFVQLFMMYLLWMDESYQGNEQRVGKQMNDAIAFAHPHDQALYMEEGNTILQGMLTMLNSIHAPIEQIAIVEEKRRLLSHPEETIAGKLYKLIEEGISLEEWATAQSKANKARSLEKPYALTGFEDMELSTQILLFDAIQKGLSIEILDRSDQFLSLRYKDHREYVKNGNMTRLDTYISPLIMANKVVTKKVLAKEGYVVPKSVEYEEVDQAIEGYPLFAKKAFVIKPKSTNFGLGITIFKEGTDAASYEEAVRLAFQEDTTILVEDFIQGTEYRFFVIGNETKAVLLRVPANVTGDGVHTIRELVEKKNEDPLRGTDHRSPLEKIALGDLERLTVADQGYSFDSVPAEGTLVYLRDNSNISTGGDSIDKTDEVHDSYKQAAVGITKAVGATIAGIDMMIPDITLPSTSEEPGYGVIEANFNPMMMMHVYPFKGTSQRLTRDVLALLFPEMEWAREEESH